jgi:hypothetical protein
MTRRANQSPEARERERIANRIRMAKARMDPAYVAEVNARRKSRDAERKAIDSELRGRLRANQKRYYDTRRSDPAFWVPRKAYLARWLAERREEEEFEAFMARVEMEEEQ